MTEAGWLTCDDPGPMIEFLQRIAALARRSWRTYTRAELETLVRENRAEFIRLVRERAADLARAANPTPPLPELPSPTPPTPGEVQLLQGKVSERKVRLFACGMRAESRHLLIDERSRRAVEVAERYADGQATREELAAAWADGRVAAEDAQDWADAGDTWDVDDWDVDPCHPLDTKDHNAWVAAEIGAWAAAAANEDVWAFAEAANEVVWDSHEDHVDDEWARELRYYDGCINILRDVFGNPFRPSPPLPPTVLAWNDGTVRCIAQGIYDDRAFGRLPILADALLDAGCDDEELIAHCRGAGPHVRGCWPVDLILGKQ